MRKQIAIFLLATFTVSQYARQVSYIECVLSNYFTAPGETCDCAKIIDKTKEATNPSPLTVLHNHTHFDDAYYPSPVLSRVLDHADDGMIFLSAGDSRLHEGAGNKPYHPPRV